eukprot:3249995-Rhodomonas_salina.1
MLRRQRPVSLVLFVTLLCSAVSGNQWARTAVKPPEHNAYDQPSGTRKSNGIYIADGIPYDISFRESPLSEVGSGFQLGSMDAGLGFGSWTKSGLDVHVSDSIDNLEEPSAFRFKSRFTDTPSVKTISLHKDKASTAKDKASILSLKDQ